jgi:hypothetical protein
MSDPIAQAAEALSAAPVTGNVLVNETPVVAAPVVEAGTATVGEQSASATPTVSTTVENSSSDASQPSTQAETELPRESHLMLLEHKLAAMHAKFKTGERIVIDEFEQILGHIRAVL